MHASRDDDDPRRDRRLPAAADRNQGAEPIAIPGAARDLDEGAALRLPSPGDDVPETGSRRRREFGDLCNQTRHRRRLEAAVRHCRQKHTVAKSGPSPTAKKMPVLADVAASAMSQASTAHRWQLGI